MTAMKEATRNFLVGLTSLVAIAALVLLLFWFGELEPLIRGRYMLTIHTDDALGLRPGSTVQLNGVPIGTVHDISIGGDISFPVRIESLIRRDVAVPKTAVPFAETSLLGASAVLHLDARLETMKPPLEFHARDGTASITEPLRIRMIEQITAELDARMAPVLEALKSFQQLSDTYTALGENLNALVAPGEEQAEGEGRATLQDTVTKLNSVLDRAEEAMALAEEWLGDEQMRADARNAVKKASTLIDEVSATLDRYIKLADELEADTKTVVNRLVPVADEMSEVLTEVRRLTRLAGEGEGTMGQLLNNPDLYNALEDAAVRLEKALRDVQLLVEKLRAEGVKIEL